jgi:NAD(P)-dependent dehydrogenase (short-subunit alcohol dehydrogenase family)
MDLSSRTCIVTGANTGLGFEVARRFAASGADTTLLCRTEERGMEAVSRIREEWPTASVRLAVCDLASLESTMGFLDEFRGSHRKLDILYNNAAVMKSRRTVTEDGFEMMFQVNYLAPFTLMTGMLDLLKKGGSPIVVNNARPSARLRLDLDDLQSERDYAMWRSFFKTKLCLVFASLELARRPDRDGVVVTMIDPEPFRSGLVRDVKLVGWLKNLVSAPVEKAAENILYHLDAKRETKNGKVFKGRQEYPLPTYWQDERISGLLWSMTESMLARTRP